MSEQGKTAIKIQKLTELFESDLWPFWSWAAFIDLTEFWTPSYCDYVRQPFMAQQVSLNQAMDNNEQRNKPQRAINTLAVKNLAQLKYQRGGNFIEIDGTAVPNGDVRTAIQTMEVPTIDSAFMVYDKLEAIVNKASGVTEGAAGAADPTGKATIYEGNQAAAADRFGLLNKSYSFGYDRFGLLYEWGARENLINKVAVEILGPNGVDIQEVKNKDIFRKNDSFGITVQSSNAETDQSELEKRTKIQFLAQNVQNPVQNPKKAYEIGAGIAGFDDDTIRQLEDTENFGSAGLISEAERDIEDILDGKNIKPNQQANVAYKQRFIDYMQDHEEDLEEQQVNRMFKYMDKLNPIIITNMQRALAEKQLVQAATAPAPDPAQAPVPTPTSPEASMAPAPAEDPTATINQLAP